MHRPNFGVVTSVVVVLAAIGGLSRLVIDLIPPAPDNRLASESAEYLVQAAHQEIDWRPLGEDAFVDARKLNRPIMLVVGSAASRAGRAADKLLFTSKDVRGALARHFICVRVDSMARPEFQNAFLPLSRALIQLPMPTDETNPMSIGRDYQVWFLDSEGRLLSFAADNGKDSAFDSRTFLGHLARALKCFDNVQGREVMQAGEEDLSRFLLVGDQDKLAPYEWLLQQHDLDLIEGPAALPAPEMLVRYGEFLAMQRPGLGGFPINIHYMAGPWYGRAPYLVGSQRLWPSAWRFQLIARRYDDYRGSIMPCLESPQVDLVDGGFFTDDGDMTWRDIGYDKLATTNAAMMFTLAEGSVLTGSRFQRTLALRTFDALRDRFVVDGYIAAGQVGDEGAYGRSSRSSVPPQRLRELFPDDREREWVRQNLGLRVETNPQMTPMLQDPAAYEKAPAPYEAALDRLRRSIPEARLVGQSQIDAGGYAIARMIQAARILGDSVRLGQAEKMFDKLDDFRSLDDVAHSLARGSQVHAYLGDYLGYADAAFQYFLSTGNAAAIKHGESVLRRGLFLFAGKVSGEYDLVKGGDVTLGPQNIAAPEIIDNFRESCSALVMRLCNDYGRLLGKRGEDLQTVASDTLKRFASVALNLGQFAAGYFCAAAEMQDAAYAVTVGTDAVAQAGVLAERIPTRLVAPALGPVAKPGKAPGFYLVQGDTVHGPMSLDQVAAALQPVGT